jgi:hypothetical protein
MTTATMLMKEIETLPEEYVAEALDFVLFLRTKKVNSTPEKTNVKSMFGAFPGINTNVERDEEDRV